MFLTSLFLVTAMILGGVMHVGAQLPSSLPQGAGALSSATPSHLLMNVLRTMAVMFLAVIAFRTLLAKLGQPPVIGEMLAGIVLGPSILGLTMSGVLVPADSMRYVKVIGELGIIFYMYLIGIDLNVRALLTQGRGLFIVSQANLMVPFSIGVLLTPFLYAGYAGATSFAAFTLFMGVGMSVTAVPVLARILKDKQLQDTPMGRFAMGCAAVNDVFAWCALSIAVGVAHGSALAGSRIVVETAVFALLMIYAVRPLVAWLDVRAQSLGSSTSMMLAVSGLFLSACVADWIGVHAIFGAFLYGAITPLDGKLSQQARQTLEASTANLLVPIFFVCSGMSVSVEALLNVDSVTVLLIVILAASFGKIAGTYWGARYARMSCADALTLGVMLNTRGLVELIVLNVGFTEHIISKEMFSLMTIMALATTFCTAPFLNHIFKTRIALAA